MNLPIYLQITYQRKKYGVLKLMLRHFDITSEARH